MRKLGKYLAVVILGAGTGIAVRAQAAVAQTTEPSHADVELIEDSAGSRGPEGATTLVGVLFRLDPGWHIYWENPGDSGSPPKIQWHVPAGFKAGAIRWPAPVRLGSGTVIDYGYEKEVLLMAPITRTGGAAADGSGAISADVKYVVCSEVCIPGEAHVALPKGGDSTVEAKQWRALFLETREKLPKPWAANPKVSATQDSSHIELRIPFRTRSAITFFPLDPDVISNSAPQQLSVEDDGIHLTLVKSDQLVKPISRLRGLIVFPTGAALEIAVPVGQ